MGQRHQYWIIAKINGRYHTIAVVHHQWAYGHEPPRACWRLLQILSHPANKKLVAHELNYAATFTESWWKDLENEINPYEDINKLAPFPFTATCLALAAAFDPRPETSYYHSVSLLYTGINFVQTDNNDGFTMVDVSNLDDIHICFLFPDFRYVEEDPESGSSQITRPPSYTPLTAEEYIAEYADTPDEVKVDVDLSCWGLVNADTLRNLWPNGYWCNRNDDGPGGSRRIEQEARITSLKELTFIKVIEKHLDNPELGMIELPDFFERLRKWLHAFPEYVKAPHGHRILGLSMKGARCLDLSAFHWLPEEVIIQLVKENADVDIVDSIDLSTNTTVTATGIEKLLQVCPNITKLFTLYTPKLSMDALTGALAGSNVDEFLHTELFQSSFDRRGKRHTYATRSEAVTQIVYLSVPNSAKADDSCCLDQKGLRWSKLAEDRLGEKRGMSVKCFPVRDAFLVLTRATDWLDQLLNFFGSNPVFHTYSWGSDIHEACAKAMALELRDAWKVRPIPGETFHLDTARARIKELKIGEWTLLVAADEKAGKWNRPECEALRYAFVTRDEAGQLRTADIDDFGGRPAQLAAPSQAKHIAVPGEEALATIDWSKVTVCGVQEVADVMGPFMAMYNETMLEE